ncbi:MAG: YrhK family protein [Myxococcota bacterium]|nr:YrhK family protein [Myxococcota bacterium]
MGLFAPENRNRSQRHRDLYAAFEIAHTAVDFTAALFFVIGSCLFLDASWRHVGTWLFIVGSVLFAVRPSLRFARELKYLSMGRIDSLAERS